ncbi:hypothetical protein AAVH_23661 [Aphelenchoides avenae]|nr:hypothetical protein AAVH_23661 [Aphelenchus avenae]
MVADLADRNFSLDGLRMGTDDDRMGAESSGLSDYSSMDTIINGGMRLETLDLCLFEHELASLVKTTDFFRTPGVRKLETLKLGLGQPWHKSQAPLRRAIVSSPLWIAGICLLRNSKRFEVKNDSNRRLRTTGLKLVELCEKLESGEISELVQHFKLASRCHIAFPFKNDNKIASLVKVGSYKWDVYRLRNAITGDWLTACISEKRTEFGKQSVLHIVKGEVRPNASFAA